MRADTGHGADLPAVVDHDRVDRARRDGHRMTFGELRDGGYRPPLATIWRQHSGPGWHRGGGARVSQNLVERDAGNPRRSSGAQRAKPHAPSETIVYARALVEPLAPAAVNPVAPTPVAQ